MNLIACSAHSNPVVDLRPVGALSPVGAAPRVWRLRSRPSLEPKHRFRSARMLCVVDRAPVDFLSDPDGPCDYELLVQAAGFDTDGERLYVGALVTDFEGFPEGAAVVAQQTQGLTRIVLLEHQEEAVPTALAPHEADMQARRSA